MERRCRPAMILPAVRQIFLGGKSPAVPRSPLVGAPDAEPSGPLRSSRRPAAPSARSLGRADPLGASEGL